jgi:hypothetical protein
VLLGKKLSSLPWSNLNSWVRTSTWITLRFMRPLWPKEGSQLLEALRMHTTPFLSEMFRPPLTSMTPMLPLLLAALPPLLSTSRRSPTKLKSHSTNLLSLDWMKSLRPITLPVSSPPGSCSWSTSASMASLLLTLPPTPPSRLRLDYSSCRTLIASCLWRLNSPFRTRLPTRQRTHTLTGSSPRRCST